jgi:hypothetical protein
LSPEALASRHPRLYHVTRPHAVPSIKRHGILPANELLTLFQVPPKQTDLIQFERRSTSVDISHPVHGSATLTDNAPLSTAALSLCLDDELRPSDWLQMLSQRVFFWVDKKSVDTHLRASIKRNDARVVLVLDTLSVFRAYYEQLELAPINTGSTIRIPARRGLSTFSPAHLYTYRDWQRLRGKRDQIKEISLPSSVEDIDVHMVGYYAFPHLHYKTKTVLMSD